MSSEIISSGDTLLDRRYAYAQDLAARGDYSAAIELLQQGLDLDKNWPPLYFQLAVYYQQVENRDAAIAAYVDYLRHDPSDQMGAMVKLALIGAVPPPDTFGLPYVQALFDQYAPRFESSLLEGLAYTVPQNLFDMVERLRPSSGKNEHILDLGCGTGLAGEYFIRRAACLDGVDLSAGMIAQANTKQIYRKLEVADVSDFLSTVSAAPYHIILAADVLVYIGNLDKLMPLITRAMAPGGLFAFSVQSAPGEHFILGADHRFSHSRVYIERQLAAHGLRILGFTNSILRQDGDKEIEGHLIVAEKPPADLGTGLADIIKATKERLTP